ncbi:MAG: hypothetical protein ACRD5J_02855 [Nitrososphaeraceae archaeon]
MFKDLLERNIKVKILVPADPEHITQITKEILSTLPGLDIRIIDKSQQTSIGIIIVDKEECLIIESRESTEDNHFDDAIGLAAYSNSKPIAVSYTSIFESLWKQGELYEKLKEVNAQLKAQDKMQRVY